MTGIGENTLAQPVKPPLRERCACLAKLVKNRLTLTWLTDITEFRLPGGEKVYLSPIVDCFDGMPVAWSIGLHPDTP